VIPKLLLAFRFGHTTPYYIQSRIDHDKRQNVEMLQM